MGSIWLSEWIAIVLQYSINRLIFVIEKQYVFCEAGLEFLYTSIIQINLMFQKVEKI
jgi:hypothetical protein